MIGTDVVVTIVILRYWIILRVSLLVCCAPLHREYGSIMILWTFIVIVNERVERSDRMRDVKLRGFCCKCWLSFTNYISFFKFNSPTALLLNHLTTVDCLVCVFSLQLCYTTYSISYHLTTYLFYNIPILAITRWYEY